MLCSALKFAAEYGRSRESVALLRDLVLVERYDAFCRALTRDPPAGSEVMDVTLKPYVS